MTIAADTVTVAAGEATGAADDFTDAFAEKLGLPVDSTVLRTPSCAEQTPAASAQLENDTLVVTTATKQKERWDKQDGVIVRAGTDHYWVNMLSGESVGALHKYIRDLVVSKSALPHETNREHPAAGNGAAAASSGETPATSKPPPGTGGEPPLPAIGGEPKVPKWKAMSAVMELEDSE